MIHSRHRRSTLWVALAVGAVALVPRLMWATMRHPPPFSDLEDYHNCAVGLLEGRGFIQEDYYRAYRPPLYPFFLAGVYAVAGVDPANAYVAQALMGALTCVLLSLLIQGLIPEGCVPGPNWWPGLVGGIGFAVTGTHVFFTGVLMTETLYTLLLVSWLLVLTVASGCRTVRWTVICGVIHGLLALCRPMALAYLPVPVWMLWRLRHGGEKWPQKGVFPAVYLAGLAVVIAPWTVRNGLVLGHLTLISTNGGVNFYTGHHEGYSYWSTGEKERIRSSTELDEVEESALFYRLGIEHIMSAPGQAVTDSIKKLVYLFTPPVPPWPWGEGATQAGFERLRWGNFVSWSVPLGILSMAGALLCVNSRWRVLRPVVGAIVCHVMITLVYFARTRFRVPLEPLFLVLSVCAVAEAARYVAIRWKPDAGGAAAQPVEKP